MDFVSLFWLLFGLLLIGGEFLIPGFVIFFFGVGALLVAGITFLFPGLASNFIAQGIIWLLSSVSSLGILRRFFSKTFKGKQIMATGEDEYIDKKVMVLEDISKNKEGRVKFEGTSWKAIAYNEEIKKGEIAQIIKKDNLTLIVTKVE